MEIKEIDSFADKLKDGGARQVLIKEASYFCKSGNMGVKSKAWVDVYRETGNESIYIIVTKNYLTLEYGPFTSLDEAIEQIDIR